MGKPVPALDQFVVTLISQVPPANPFQRSSATLVMLRSIEWLPVLLTMLATTPTGTAPIVKVPDPDLVPYLMSGNCPNCGKVSAMFTMMVPFTAKLPTIFSAVTDGLPKPPRSKPTVAPVLLPSVTLAGLNCALALIIITLKPALSFHGATPSSPSWRWPRRHALPHGAPGADDSIPPAAGSATRAQGGNRRQSRFRSLPPRAAASTCRSGSRFRAAPSPVASQREIGRAH